MGNRLTKIYTRTGDKGTTTLAGGKKLSKASDIFEVIGDIDELNSQVGMVKNIANSHNNQSTETISNKLNLIHSLTVIQHLLFNLGGELAMLHSEHDYVGIEEQHIKWLEQQIDLMNQKLPPLKDFILPAGTQMMCQLHLARSVCRRAERHMVKLQEILSELDGTPTINTVSMKFVNRLSDWLFVACRFVGLSLTEREVQETLWNKDILVSLETIVIEK